MKIDSYKIESYIENIKKERIAGILLYGEDEGLIFERYKAAAHKIVENINDPFNSVALNDDELKSDVNKIIDEYIAIPMMGGKKLISVKNAGNSIAKTLEDYFKNPADNNDNFIIITAGELDSKSSLRKFAENSLYFASIPCYSDNSSSVSNIISTKLRNAGFSYKSDVINYLSANLTGNRAIIMSEIEKLILYKGEDREITLNDVLNSVVDLSSSDSNEFINEFCNLNSEKAIYSLSKLYNQGESFITIIRMMINYFMQMHLIKYEMNNGKSFDTIKLHHRIFWTQAPILQKHLNLWSEKKINYILEELMQLEIRCKGDGIDPEIELSSFALINIIKFTKK